MRQDTAPPSPPPGKLCGPESTCGLLSHPVRLSVGLTEQQRLVRKSSREICASFDDAYWRDRARTGEYPHEFVDTLAEDGWLGALVPTESGGFGVATEYDVERYFGEARLTRLVPITQELALNYVGEKVLDLPRSY